MTDCWSTIVAEAKAARDARESFAVHAYSEFMPPPYVALKPATPEVLAGPARGLDRFAVSELEELLELRPGLAGIAKHVITELGKLARGAACELSKAMLHNNPAWPPLLEQAAKELRSETFPIILPLALSRTQDDKGRVRWTLFGSSHLGPARAFWQSFSAQGESSFVQAIAWLLELPAPRSVAELAALGVRVLGRAPQPDRPEMAEGPLPAFTQSLLWSEAEPLGATRALVTFESFARLPGPVQNAVAAGAMRLVPWPATIAFWEHPRYRKLAHSLPWAMQIPLLHLFARSESGHEVRIPQSGWLDEGPHEQAVALSGSRLRNSVRRSHRFQRHERDALPAEGAHFEDRVTVALFSPAADDLGLYGKPMARNAQVWSSDYELLLDGPRATRAQTEQAAARVRSGGRFGYRFLYPPMQAGLRALFWHRPLLARLDPATGEIVLPQSAPLGFLTAERAPSPTLELVPELEVRPVLQQAAEIFERDPGRRRHTTLQNVRRVLEAVELLGAPIAPSFARALLDASKGTSWEHWLQSLGARTRAGQSVEAVVAALRKLRTSNHPGP